MDIITEALPMSLLIGLMLAFTASVGLNYYMAKLIDKHHEDHHGTINYFAKRIADKNQQICNLQDKLAIKDSKD